MNQELNDLFEVADFMAVSSNGANTTKRVLLRILALIIITSTPFLCMLIPGIGVDKRYGLLFVGFFSPIVWFAFMLLETLILQIKKKYDKRNTNLILFGVFLLIYFCILYRIT